MTCCDCGSSWFLVQLKPNCARIAEKNLQRQGFRTFMPLEEQTRNRRGRFVSVTRPLFPGYIFVAFDRARGLWRTINSTRGIARLVSFGAAPAAVPQDLVARLMQRCDDAGRLLPTTGLQPGDRVILTKGPFAEFVAQVEHIHPDRRVWLLMDIMGSRSRVMAGADQMRAI